jgi:uncharacterized LabA/DUF88 family protein
MDLVSRFVKKEKCPDLACAVTAEQALKKREQKLVDTLLACDIVTLAVSGVKEIVLVSSDDDFWPAIHAAASFGTKIIRILTRSPSLFNPSYASLITTGYAECRLP